MKKQKMNLNDLKVDSFVTQTTRIKGGRNLFDPGGGGGGTGVCTLVQQYGCSSPQQCIN